MPTQDQEAFLGQLREIFALEAGEHLRALQEGLFSLEKELLPEESPLIQPIFRAAHSLKGAARAVDLLDIESICHAVESVFSSVQKKDLSLGPALFDSLNKAIDRIDSLVKGEKLSAQAIKDLVAELGKKTESPKAPAAQPAPVHPGLDAVEIAPKPDSLKPAATLRVSAERLEKILTSTEELIPLKLAFSRNVAAFKDLAEEFKSAMGSIPVGPLQIHLADKLDSAKAWIGKSQDDLRGFNAVAESLMEDARYALMLPCAHITAGFPKMIRDLSRDLGKDIGFSVEGETLELEKTILERIKDPLVHLLRNCADHGIESPHERQGRGKSSQGKIRLSAQPLDDGMVEFVIEDDGRGVDIEKIRNFAVKTGNLSVTEAQAVEKSALLDRIFLPGFTTSPMVTDISGRGMGLAIVKEAVEELGGSISLDTDQGKGSVFRLILPSSRATFQGIAVSLGTLACIVPTANVVKVLRVKQMDIHSHAGAETITVDGKPHPVLPLGDLLGLPRNIRPDTPAYLQILLTESGGAKLGLLVEAVLDEEEVLVKPLGSFLAKLKHVLGVALLGNGDILPVLDLRTLVRAGLSEAQSPGKSADSGHKAPEKQKSILVVEDSITSRTLIKSILESAGYKVDTANDGIEGLTSLKEGNFDLLVSDVEMPRLDGFGLIEALRADPRFLRLPAILVTSLETREHREKGVAAGANAYIAKSDFAQSNLLETIRRFI
ncbi:MAG: two-component system chemotaxis family sensor kinase CheA [Spirochaetes bacterium]|nr:MAG: two-component system chemotaxis family sensor kinase CheA [Spirochaetota bacterium]